MYHPEEMAHDPTAVERLVCEEIFKSEKVRATIDQATAFAQIAACSHKTSQEFITMQKEKDPVFASYIERVETFPIKMDPKLQIWVSNQFSPHGMKAVLLIAYYLQWFAFRSHQKRLSLFFVSKTVMNPELVPHENTLFRIWDEQKVKSTPDNLIDHADAVQSFMPGYGRIWMQTRD